MCECGRDEGCDKCPCGRGWCEDWVYERGGDERVRVEGRCDKGTCEDDPEEGAREDCSDEGARKDCSDECMCECGEDNPEREHGGDKPMDEYSIGDDERGGDECERGRSR